MPLWLEKILDIISILNFLRLVLLPYIRASSPLHMVKNLPAMWETQVLSLNWEDPLEEGMATHSSIRAWRIPRTEVPSVLPSMGSLRV